jgi:hypothetical protein
MPFIGNQPALSYTSFAKQDFTTSATTSYTLDNPVTNENEIALFINFVRQEPTTAYTATGTSLTLTSATSATDDMYCVFLGKAVQTVNPPNGSVGNSQLDVSAINSQTAETSIAGGDEVLIYDTSASALRKMTRTNFVSGIGGVMTPYFSAYRSGNQTISNQTATKVEFNQELFDSDNTYDSTTNYRFTPTTAGKYWLNASAQLSGSLDTGTVYFYIQKNGSTLQGIDEKYIYSSIATSFSLETSCLVDANGSSDYFDCFFYRYAGSAPLRSGSAFTNFNGFKLIE